LCHRYFIRGLPTSLVMVDFSILCKTAYTWLFSSFDLSITKFSRFFTLKISCDNSPFKGHGDFFRILYISSFLLLFTLFTSWSKFRKRLSWYCLSEMLLISMKSESTERMYECKYFDKLLLSKIIVVIKNSASDYRVFPAYDLSCYHRVCIYKR
jgi:hypothetical protein